MPTNASASLSLLKVGIFFFIVLNFLSVHVASSNGPDILFTFLLADREGQKDMPPQGCSACGLEARFRDRVRFIGQNHNGPQKKRFYLFRADSAAFERGEAVFRSLASSLNASPLRNLITAMRAYAHARQGNCQLALRLADDCIHGLPRYPRIEPVVKTFARIAEHLAENGKTTAMAVANSTQSLVGLRTPANERDEALKAVAEAVKRNETILSRPSQAEHASLQRTLLNRSSSEILSGFSANPKTVLASELVRAAVHLLATKGPRPYQMPLLS